MDGNFQNFLDSAANAGLRVQNFVRTDGALSANSKSGIVLFNENPNAPEPAVCFQCHMVKFFGIILKAKSELEKDDEFHRGYNLLLLRCLLSIDIVPEFSDVPRKVFDFMMDYVRSSCKKHEIRINSDVECYADGGVSGLALPMMVMLDYGFHLNVPTESHSTIDMIMTSMNALNLCLPKIINCADCDKQYKLVGNLNYVEDVTGKQGPVTKSARDVLNKEPVRTDQETNKILDENSYSGNQKEDSRNLLEDSGDKIENSGDGIEDSGRKIKNSCDGIEDYGDTIEDCGGPANDVEDQIQNMAKQNEKLKQDIEKITVSKRILEEKLLESQMNESGLLQRKRDLEEMVEDAEDGSIEDIMKTEKVNKMIQELADSIVQQKTRQLNMDKNLEKIIDLEEEIKERDSSLQATELLLETEKEKHNCALQDMKLLKKRGNCEQEKTIKKLKDTLDKERGGKEELETQLDLIKEQNKTLQDRIEEFELENAQLHDQVNKNEQFIASQSFEEMHAKRMECESQMQIYNRTSIKAEKTIIGLIVGFRRGLMTTWIQDIDLMIDQIGAQVPKYDLKSRGWFDSASAMIRCAAEYHKCKETICKDFERISAKADNMKQMIDNGTKLDQLPPLPDLVIPEPPQLPDIAAMHPPHIHVGLPSVVTQGAERNVAQMSTNSASAAVNPPPSQLKEKMLHFIKMMNLPFDEKCLNKAVRLMAMNKAMSDQDTFSHCLSIYQTSLTNK